MWWNQRSIRYRIHKLSVQTCGKWSFKTCSPLLFPPPPPPHTHTKIYWSNFQVKSDHQKYLETHPREPSHGHDLANNSSQMYDNNIPNVLNQSLSENRAKFVSHSFPGCVWYTCNYFIKCNIPPQDKYLIENFYVCNLWTNNEIHIRLCYVTSWVSRIKTHEEV